MANERQHFDVSREALGLPNENVSLGKEENKKKVEKVVQGTATKHEKSVAQKTAETFFGGDLRDVFRSTLMDVLIPAAKNMFFDTFTQGLSRLLWNGGQEPVSSRRTNTYRIDYSGRSRNTSSTRVTSRNTYSFDNVTLPTRDDAERVIQGLYDILDQYKAVTVADFYGLTGITSAYTDERWGWTDLRGINVQRVREGFRINIPRQAMEL